MTILTHELCEVSSGTFRTVHTFQCDFCLSTYKREEKKSRREKPTHYCSLECANQAQKRDGVLDLVRRQGFRERLGVEYPQQSDKVKERSRQSCLKKYGVTNVQQDPSIKRRTHETFLNRLEKRQREVGVLTSKVENRFYDVLCQEFGAANVVRQKRVNRWPIDFCVTSLDVFVQFDGVYWHGLDRPLEEIAKCANSHDQEIYSRRERDLIQNEWFAKHNMSLVRITDHEFRVLNTDELMTRIRIATCKSQSR